MDKTTKTLNPLPFENLEPHRFEDLVRQILYDFRDWRLLEPTGRLGADDGYDARGFEITKSDELEDEQEESIETSIASDRLWQIQCKRERVITPVKIEKYIDEMIPVGADIPHGVIFACACDFSKKTRDTFKEKLRLKGVQECYLWGRADLEDMLLQPKNDNLLYGYFGISLQIRKRSRKTHLRSILSTKRKTITTLGPIHQGSHILILIRDFEDKSYPYVGNIKDFLKKPRWKKYIFKGHTYDGIKVLYRRYPAYRELSPSGELLKWDYTEEVNLAIQHDDVWNKGDDYDEKSHRALNFLDGMNPENACFFELSGTVPYERIIAIDPDGDNISHGPHLYIETKKGGFFEHSTAKLTSRGTYGSSNHLTLEDEAKRMEFFPKKLPKVSRPKPLPPMGKSTKDKEDEFEGLKDK